MISGYAYVVISWVSAEQEIINVTSATHESGRTGLMSMPVECGQLAVTHHRMQAKPFLRIFQSIGGEFPARIRRRRTGRTNLGKLRESRGARRQVMRDCLYRKLDWVRAP